MKGIGFPSCLARFRNRAVEGRDPRDGCTELRKEFLCSHLNRDRCWRRREVGHTDEKTDRDEELNSGVCVCV